NNTFNAATPLNGYLSGVDNGSGGMAETLNVSLTSNTLYYSVLTGFMESDVGSYTLSFSGAGVVTQVNIPTMPGDYNRDNVVDAADYPLWRHSLGSSVPLFSGADGNGNGTIDS